MAPLEKLKRTVNNPTHGGKPVKPERTPMHKYREQEKQQNKEVHQTMGIATVEVSPDKNPPKHSKKAKLPEKKPFSRTDVQPRKPARPAPTIQPPTQCNPQRNIKSVPSKPKPECADANSVLVPRFTKKKDFGKIPEYMRKEREAKEKAQEYDRQMKEKMSKLAEAEHQKILQDLKTKFTGLLNEYSNMPLTICTTSAKQKKLFLEKQMDQLEKDIKLKERYIATHISVG